MLGAYNCAVGRLLEIDMKPRFIMFALAVFFPVLALGQSLGPLVQPGSGPSDLAGYLEKRGAAAAAAPRVADTYGSRPLAELLAADPQAQARLAELRAWNQARRVPLRNGFDRALPAPAAVQLAAEQLDTPLAEHAGGMVAQPTFDRLAWGAAVRVERAWRLRLHLARVHLPQGTRLWVHGEGESAGPFGAELIAPDGGLWTPSVAGENAAIDVDVPARALAAGARVSFTIDRVAQLFAVDPDGQPVEDAAGSSAAGIEPKLGACNVDSSCASTRDFPGVFDDRHAIARLVFMDGGSSFLCTGSLLNDTATDFAPYMLTANHCISTQASASSLEAFWDYFTDSCNGTAPSLGSVPRSNGSQLLATGSAGNASDYTLLNLNQLPPGRVFLGWNADPNAAPDGTLLYRLSHPEGQTQNYVVTQSNSSVQACGRQFRPRFLYSNFVQGGTFGGSSGSPLMLRNGQVVGQLYGGCGNPDDCSPLQYTLDGAFAASFPALQPFLDNGSGGGGCRADQFSLCLLGGRFRVQVAWQNQYNNTAGSGNAIASSDSTGFFYFFDPSNYELILKILNFGNVIKVFYGQLTDLHFTITVTDTVSGTVKTYTNTPGNCGGIDQAAFQPDKALPQPAGGCVPDANTLCLLGSRLALRVAWTNQYNNTSGQGAPQTLSDESGLFTFTDRTNVELVVKALDFNGQLRIFYGALSDLDYTITVTDTATGRVKSYHNPGGHFCGGIDNNAF